MSTKVAFRGVPFENGFNEDGTDNILIIPPLPINKVRDATKEVAEIKEDDPLVQVHKQNERVKDIIHDAIKRNYPNFTREQLDDFLNYQNIQGAYQAALGSSATPDGKPLPQMVRSPGEMTPNETYNQ